MIDYGWDYGYLKLTLFFYFLPATGVPGCNLSHENAFVRTEFRMFKVWFAVSEQSHLIIPNHTTS